MISISLDQLRDFQKRTQYIKPNTTLPALGYIKMETKDGSTYLTKNNQRAVCVAKIKGSGADHGPVLLKDNIFFAALNGAETDSITISWDSGRVYITDGRTPMYHGREAAENFPKTPDYEAATSNFKFGKGHLDSIGIAKSFILDTETGGNFRFIHIGGNFICGAHTNFYYVSARFEGLPDIFMDGETADVLTGSGAMEYNFATSERHYFFQDGSVVYIFTQQEARKLDIKTALWDKFQLPGKEFTILRSDLVAFCGKANAATDSELARCTIEPGIGVLNLSMVDSSRNQGANKTVKLDGEADRFNFDSKLYLAPIRTIPYENLKCKMKQNNLMICSPDAKEWFIFTGLN